MSLDNGGSMLGGAALPLVAGALVATVGAPALAEERKESLLDKWIRTKKAMVGVDLTSGDTASRPQMTIDEFQRQNFPYLVVRHARDADAAGCSYGLQACGDIDAIAE